MASLYLADFSGGLNLRDSPNQIDPRETPSSFNFTLDERGGLKWRNGCLNAAALPGVSGKDADIFYSAALDQWLCVRETTGAPNTIRLHTRPGDFTGVWTDRGALSTSLVDRAAFIDFPGNPPKVVMVAGNAGVWTWDGTTLTQVSTTVKGKAIALWQNKAWIAGAELSDANGNPTRLYYSAVADPTTWGATTQFVDLRDLDAAPLTALGVAASGLVAFKKRSAYRINDSSSGAYSTIDPGVGCLNPRALVALRGRLYSWAATGLYECDGVSKLVNIGDKVRPLYAQNATTPVCGGAFGDHLLFAITGTQLLEVDPARGWAMRHQLASIAANEPSSFSVKDGALYGAIKDGDRIFKMFSESGIAIGVDDGVLAVGNYSLPWLLPNSGMLSRLQRARIQGFMVFNGTTTLAVEIYKDWEEVTPSLTFQIEGSLRGASSIVNNYADVMSLGHAAAYKIRFVTGTPGGNAGGDTRIRSVQLIDTPLQYPNPGYPPRPGVSSRPTPAPSGRAPAPSGGPPSPH